MACLSTCRAKQGCNAISSEQWPIYGQWWSPEHRKLGNVMCVWSEVCRIWRKLVCSLAKTEDTGVTWLSTSILPIRPLRSFLGPPHYYCANSSRTLWQGLSDVPHTVLIINPLARAGTKSMGLGLTQPSAKPRTTLKYNWVIHTLPEGVKTGTSF